MQIVINTIAGTFLVPQERESDLIYWLTHNATRIDSKSISEQARQNNQYVGTQLLNELKQ